MTVGKPGEVTRYQNMGLNNLAIMPIFMEKLCQSKLIYRKDISPISYSLVLKFTFSL